MTWAQRWGTTSDSHVWDSNIMLHALLNTTQPVLAGLQSSSAGKEGVRWEATQAGFAASKTLTVNYPGYEVALAVKVCTQDHAPPGSPSLHCVPSERQKGDTAKQTQAARCCIAPAQRKSVYQSAGLDL